jgi:hypothetical protein
MLPLLVAAALAQPVTAVPPGVSAVTVFVCPPPDGCVAERRAMAAHTRRVGMPMLDLAVVTGGRSGEREALRDFEHAMAPVRRGEADPAAIAGLLASLDQRPFAIGADDLFRLWIAEGANRFPSVEADHALAAAASVSGGRVADLGSLAPDVRARYLALVEAGVGARGGLRIVADGPGRVSVDGGAVGDTPLAIAVSAGWHRVSVERDGRAAWVASVEVPTGQILDVGARFGRDDDTAALVDALVAARRGASSAPAVVDPLRAWARANGLAWVRFVELRPTDEGRVPEECVPDPDPAAPGWDVLAVYLDVETGRLGPHGPGPAAMRTAADPDRFRLGAALGYLRVVDFVPDIDTDGAATDAVSIELVGTWRFRPALAVDARAGFAHDVVGSDRARGDRYPVSVGVRLGRAAGGPYAVAGAIGLLPSGLGGQGRVGWDLAPSLGWRIAPEITAGVVDTGWFVGGTVDVLRLR